MNKLFPLIVLLLLFAFLLMGCPQKEKPVNGDDPLDLGEISEDQLGDGGPLPEKIHMPTPDASTLPEGKTFEEVTQDIDSMLDEFNYNECLVAAQGEKEEFAQSIVRDFCEVMNATKKAIREHNPDYCAVAEDLENAPFGETDVEVNPVVVPLSECYKFTAIYWAEPKTCDEFVWPDFLEDSQKDCRAIASRQDFKCLVLQSPVMETCKAIIHGKRSECGSIEDELYKDLCRARVKRWEKVIK